MKNQYELAQPKRALIVAALTFALLIISVLVQQDSPSSARVEVPDFSSIPDVKTKKQTFFDFFRPIVENENKHLKALREKILNTNDEDYLTSLAEQYRLKDIRESHLREDLLKRIETIPASLVLAQAAIESAWGTSRFATEGYNYFGQWCFSQGCGIVPAARAAGAAHEVRKFDSPIESVSAYFFNLNSHPSYETLRTIRAEARKNSEEVTGCELAAGLQHYSERGQHYVEEVKQLIRTNDLSANESAC